MTDIVDRMRARKLPTIEVDMHYPQIVDSDEADAECTEAADEIDRLRAALKYALNTGVGTQYWGDEDECGTHSCCGEVSYKPHDPDCWTLKARAALAQPAPEQEVK